MKPIIFNTLMVQSIDLDIKTSTRRIIKPQPSRQADFGHEVLIRGKNHFWPYKLWTTQLSYNSFGIPTPFENNFELKLPYHVGDILYVRETWQQMYETECYDKVDRGYINIRDIISNFDEIPKVEAGISWECRTAQMEPRMKYYVFRATNIEYADPDNFIHWRPAIHMPKEAARTFLRVTSIRPQWLQDITAEDALREGIIVLEGEDPRDVFADVWNSTLTTKNFSELCWTANPAVWAIDFEKISRDEALSEEVY